MEIALYIRHIDESARPYLGTLQETLHQRGIATREVSDGDSVDGCDFLFTIGGDGTLLSSVRFVHSSDPSAFPPILGINFGHLGFLTTVGKESAAGLADDLLAGRYSLEERTLLQVDNQSYALNEVFLHRSDASTLLRTEVEVDGAYVATYAGDGVIVATPTGSTAYSLSCGGPILHPRSDVQVLTPIASHSLSVRPLVIPADTDLTIEVNSRAGYYSLALDTERLVVPDKVKLLVRKERFHIRTVLFENTNFFDIIREKLLWGLDKRND